MQALFEAAKESVQEISKGSLESPVYKEECLKLGRYVSKVTLILAELELQLYADESLRGSEDMFIAVEAVLQGLQQAASLVQQCSSTSAGRIWPMEDAVEFQSVALELLNAMEKVASAHYTVPEDLQEDIEHFLRQLQKLNFTEAELEESAADELTSLQIENKNAREDAISSENEGKTTDSARFEGKTPPSGVISNIKPFRSAATASAAAVEELDDTWEEIEHEEEEENDKCQEDDDTGRQGDGLNNDEKEETFEKVIENEEEEEKKKDGEEEIQAGAVEEGKEADLPSDPFRMQEGAQAQVEENARLSEETVRALEELKKASVSAIIS
ncbi:hypothetical protein Ndes2437A_g03911 [Nannochloris sp. 'desiccata']